MITYGEDPSGFRSVEVSLAAEEEVFHDMAECIGDLATRLTLVVLMTVRIITELLRLIFMTLDRFVMDLGERSESGLRRVEISENEPTHSL